MGEILKNFWETFRKELLDLRRNKVFWDKLLEKSRENLWETLHEKSCEKLWKIILRTSFQILREIQEIPEIPKTFLGIWDIPQKFLGETAVTFPGDLPEGTLGDAPGIF